MFRYLTLFIAFFSFCLVGNSSSRLFGQDTLKTKLRELDQMQNGKNTPFNDVEKRGEELLAEFTTPEEQGQIYFSLPQYHGKAARSVPIL